MDVPAEHSGRVSRWRARYRPDVLRHGSGIPDRLTPSRAEPKPPPPRRAYFGEAGWIETPILRRSDLAGERPGPLIIEEYDATCVVPPNATASLDSTGNVVISLG